ncbi:MAG: flavin reductase family protein [Acidimicrobiales bacterium]
MSDALWAPADQPGHEGEPGETLDQARYREVLGHFASGVTVVTTVERGRPWGFTCQAFAALSLTPELVAFAAARSSATWPRIEATRTFCVNVLGEGQEALARAFATKGAHKFAGVGWAPGATGSPVLADALAWVECRLEQALHTGDHLLGVGRVVDLGVGRGRPLIFYRGGFGRFEA